MADELDPHRMVALMSCIFPGLQTAQHGIVDNYHVNVGTIPILDALAHICVSQEDAQGVAVALQLDSRNKRIRLVLAENKEVQSGLVDHLTSVLGKLQNLSDEYAKWRTEELEDPVANSPPIPPKVANHLRVEIFRDIYQYSLKKQMKRIKKWWRRLGGFISEMLQRRTVGNLEHLERILYDAVVALLLVVELVCRLDRDTENTLTQDEWEGVYLRSRWVNENAKIVLDVDSGLNCEALALEIHDGHSKDPFPLRRALTKLTSLSRHIDSLIGFAHSPRLRPTLQYEISIFPVPNQPRNVRLPTSRKEWESFLETAYGDHESSQEANAVKLSQRFRFENYECPVHCECALIQYLQVNQHNDWDNISAFSYIGVSKLSCSACRTWIEAFNQQGGPQFYTRGSHGKWYWPWGLPREESLEEVGQSLGGKMALKVFKEYLTQMGLPKPRGRKPSDSSGVSESGAEDRLADDEAARGAADRNTALQKFGGDFIKLFHAYLPDHLKR
ncbi:hypothetical protein HOY82DRAFT_24952 [Tuber indicum]|nr:hypothetical protein HOY82DRAFT_24952 [Tuber indicum]